MKALDIVRTPKGSIGLVTETNGQGREVQISFIGPSHNEKNAWWDSKELTLLDSLPHLLARATAHPFSGLGRSDADLFFGNDGKV